MRLLIVSHTPHYRSADALAGWGPTVREIDWLATLFDEVVHIAPLHTGPPPRSAMFYQRRNVRLHTVPASGGDGVCAKARVFLNWPVYALAIAEELGACDIVHVRCPANIGLLASLMLAVTRHPRSRWIKYAGNWRPEGGEALSYAFQRWWLRKPWHRGVVTVNGNWAGEPAHIHPFLNPCLTEKELENASSSAARKELTLPIRLLFVGRADEGKGIGRAVEITRRLLAKDIPVVLDVVGDGPSRSDLERLVAAASCNGLVRFHGWLPRTELEPIYEMAHILLLPTTSSEGWPKVLGEGMAYGVVPLAGAVSCIPDLLREYRTGRAHAASNKDAFVSSIAKYAAAPEEWLCESRAAIAAARHFTYERHLERVSSLLSLSDDGTCGARALLSEN